ncbi:MAG: YkgJ family cysteine cluster protein [Candidatus Electrothrix aestuarii]|uniref:YkgJ family cysteine cluster protein n=1 Tax=Candidatus Electrothrix aestuarii TaxID=3062594 RepID=A0AAU8M113_9BACT|nr:YkgJ family cysteine cluster protein [Candidatus Electrothrix aestuarii]
MPQKNLHYHNDFPYFFNSDACTDCGGKCCRGSQGYIWLNMEELENMAKARGISPDAFARQYVRQVNGGLSLQERIINNEHLCCFLDPVDHYCTIYQQRPEQCRTFPFWEQLKTAFRELMHDCPGIESLR